LILTADYIAPSVEILWLRRDPLGTPSTGWIVGKKSRSLTSAREGEAKEDRAEGFLTQTAIPELDIAEFKNFVDQIMGQGYFEERG